MTSENIKSIFEKSDGEHTLDEWISRLNRCPEFAVVEAIKALGTVNLSAISGYIADKTSNNELRAVVLGYKSYDDLMQHVNSYKTLLVEMGVE